MRKERFYNPPFSVKVILLYALLALGYAAKQRMLPFPQQEEMKMEASGGGSVSYQFTSKR